MSTQLEAVHDAKDDLRLKHAELEVAERRLSDPGSSVLAVTKAEAAWVLAARRLAEAVDALPLQDRPRGWAA